MFIYVYNYFIPLIIFIIILFLLIIVFFFCFVSLLSAASPAHPLRIQIQLLSCFPTITDHHYHIYIPISGSVLSGRGFSPRHHSLPLHHSHKHPCKALPACLLSLPLYFSGSNLQSHLFPVLYSSRLNTNCKHLFSSFPSVSSHCP